MNTNEILLTGGKSTQSVVRIKNTVHRTLHSNSKFIHQLLKLLEEKEYPYSPRFLGIDEQGREILTFMKGEVAREDVVWTDEQLIKITRMIKEFHNATTESQLTGDMEVVCHNDLAPWNLITKDSNIIGFIDFDDALPGSRIKDFAYFLWTFLELGNDVNVKEQARRIKLLSQAYDSFNSTALVDAILNEQERILRKRKYLAENDISKEDRDFSKLKIDAIKLEIDWVKTNRTIIEETLDK